MQKIRIDFDNPGLPQHISAVENDSQSRFFQATLYENGKAYTAPEGATYSIMYRGFGPQNQGWYDTINDGAGKRAACAVSGNVVTCEIARQALQVPGHVSIVLCVTTGKGYMLKSWPIECDCKNDRYDSTVEIQSFFYVTQVTNADWMQAIQAWENLKDAIDPTLSFSGKAADAKATGDTVGQLKEDLCNVIKNSDAYVVNDSGSINGARTYSATLFKNEKYLILYESSSNLPHTIFVDGKDIESANKRNCIIEYIPEVDKKSIGFWISGNKDVDYIFKVLHIVNGGIVIDLTKHFAQKIQSTVEINYILKAEGLLISSTPDGVLTELVTTKTIDYSHPFSTFTSSSNNTDVLFKIDDGTGNAPFLIEDNQDTLKKIKVYFVTKSQNTGYDITLSANDSREFAKRKSDFILNGENDTDVLTSLMSCTEGIKIFLYNGTYNINKYWTYDKCKCSIASWTVPSGNKKRSVILHGEMMTVPTSEDGVFFAVSQNLHDNWDDNANNIMMGIPYNIGASNFSRYQIDVKNINIMGICYDKKVTYVDYFFADSVAIKSVNVRSWNKYPTEYKAFDDTPEVECTGIRVGHSSNFGIQNYIKNTNIWYCGKGIVCNGEHYILEDVKVHHCYIGWVFGDRHDPGHVEHPNIVIGCSTEACYQLGWLTKDGIMTDISFDDAHAKNDYIMRSTLIIIGMSVEMEWQIPINEIIDSKTADTLPFWEIVHKAYRGRIEIDLYGRKPFTVEKPELNSNMTWVSYPNEN